MSSAGSDDSDAQGRDLVGTTVAGRYLVVRLLGRGGMGAVYEAVQQPLGRRVALKVIRRSLSDEPSAVKRFTQEAQAVAQLSHPNVVTLFDFGQTHEGQPAAGQPAAGQPAAGQPAAKQLFLAMELLEGRSLQRALGEDGAIPWERALVIVTEVCRALVEAHEKGIIHRDLKPDNVMLLAGRDQRVKVVDFGIAKLLESGAGQSSMTGTGLVVGTPGYISPEQVNGVSDDPRSDLYALGVLWFEMLTGRAPFEGETPMKVVLRHLHDPAPRPSALATTSLPREIDALVQRLLSKEPAARAASSAALLDELLALGARGKELAEEVVTASLSHDEVRAVVERARPSLPTAGTPATAAVPAMPTAPVVVSAPPPKKQTSAALWLVGCLAIPALVVVALTFVAVVALVRGPPSSVTVSVDGDAAKVDSGFGVMGAPVADEVIKKAVGKQLGQLVESALTGESDAGVGDLAVKGALEVALESIDKSPDPLTRQVALRDLIRDLEHDLAEDPELSPSRRRVLERIIQKAKRLRALDDETREERVEQRREERRERVRRRGERHQRR